MAEESKQIAKAQLVHQGDGDRLGSEGQSYCGHVPEAPAEVQERRQHASAFLSLCLCQVCYYPLGQSKSLAHT